MMKKVVRVLMEMVIAILAALNGGLDADRIADELFYMYSDFWYYTSVVTMGVIFFLIYEILIHVGLKTLKKVIK